LKQRSAEGRGQVDDGSCSWGRSRRSSVTIGISSTPSGIIFSPGSLGDFPRSSTRAHAGRIRICVSSRASPRRHEKKRNAHMVSFTRTLTNMGEMRISTNGDRFAKAPREYGRVCKRIDGHRDLVDMGREEDVRKVKSKFIKMYLECIWKTDFFNL